MCVHPFPHLFSSAHRDAQVRVQEIFSPAHRVAQVRVQEIREPWNQLKTLASILDLSIPRCSAASAWLYRKKKAYRFTHHENRRKAKDTLSFECKSRQISSSYERYTILIPIFSLKRIDWLIWVVSGREQLKNPKYENDLMILSRTDFSLGSQLKFSHYTTCR